MNVRLQDPLPSPGHPTCSASVAWMEALAATAPIEKNPARLLSHVIAERAAIHGAAPALLSERECFSFSELNNRINSYAAWATSNGLQHGDRVALLMSNRPEYVAIWLGLTSAGVITALINTNLSGRSLAHCLELAQPRAIIAEPDLLNTLIVSAPDWSNQAERPEMWCHDAPHPMARELVLDLNAGVDHTLEDRVPVTINDTALLIYTSGTTGLPKAAKVSHRRILNWALWFKGMLGNTEADRMYDCLPLYHSVGGVVAVAATLAAGGSTVIAEKFSARGFWSDIRKWNCTQVQYIGELCRYLLNTPPTEQDGRHGLRLACGNGLRADVWDRFRERFAIPQIIEFYAATEGNFSLFNLDGKVGAIGRIPSYLRHRFPTAIIKYDTEEGRPFRDDDGRCVRAETGEAGEAIGRIGNGSDGSGRFDGYTDGRESDKKILRDVFEPGDAWFRTGDLMRLDAAGYYFFVDRIGDTYRWKGENVSTLEVANVLTLFPGVKDAVVYGVDVPGADGKAGMAFLDIVEGFDLEAFQTYAADHLPAYAVPRFLRLGTSASVTETFKHKKQDLVRDGYDPRSSNDPVFVLSVGRYRQMNDAQYATIRTGGARF